MKNDRLIYAFGQIDDGYILEAKPQANNYEERKKKMNRKMNRNKIVSFFKRPMAAVAALVLCVCVSGVTALAATGTLQGFFRDIVGRNGAVVGTTYEQASEELTLTIREMTDTMVIEVIMVDPYRAPYSELEMLGIEKYRIVDMDNKLIAEGAATEMAEIADGKASVSISVEKVPAGKYKLIVSEMVGGKKADQPIVLHGNWECDFAR